MYHITQKSRIHQDECVRSSQDLEIHVGDFFGLDRSTVILVPERMKPVNTIITRFSH